MVRARTTRIEYRGEYEIRFHSSGAFTAYGEGVREKGQYVPPDQKIRERNDKDIAEKGKMSQVLMRYLGFRGMLETGKISVPAGREVLGIKLRPIETKNGPVERRTKRSEITEAIQSAWPQEVVAAYNRGETPKVMSLTEFSIEYPRAQRAARRQYKTGEGLRKFIEEVYPGWYDKIKKLERGHEIDHEETKREIAYRISEGLPITKAALLRSPADSPERKLGYRINTLARRKLIPGCKSFYEVIEKLTGIKRSELEIDSGTRKLHGTISEQITHLLLVWKNVLGLDSGVLPQGLPKKAEGDIVFIYSSQEGDKRGFADFRIGNTAVEVKTGMEYFSPARLRRIVDKYAGKGTKWASGEPVERSIVLLHQPENQSGPAALELRKEGIEAFDREWFAEQLSYLVATMKEKGTPDTSTLRPRIFDLDYLVGLYDEIAQKPDVLMRKANRDRRDWSVRLLKALTQRGYELLDGS